MHIICTPPDACAISLYNNLLCNGTCAVAGGGGGSRMYWRGGGGGYTNGEDPNRFTIDLQIFPNSLLKLVPLRGSVIK